MGFPEGQLSNPYFWAGYVNQPELQEPDAPNGTGILWYIYLHEWIEIHGFHVGENTIIGGDFRNYVLFSLESLGEMIQFDDCAYFFRWGWLIQPPTRQSRTFQNPRSYHGLVAWLFELCSSVWILGWESQPVERSGIIPIGSMGLVCLPTWMGDFYGKCIDKHNGSSGIEWDPLFWGRGSKQCKICGIFWGITPKKIVHCLGWQKEFAQMEMSNVNRNCSRSHFLHYVLVWVSIPSHVIFHSKTIPTVRWNIPQLPQIQYERILESTHVVAGLGYVPLNFT